jgi:hypothetical protein
VRSVILDLDLVAGTPQEDASAGRSPTLGSTASAGATRSCTTSSLKGPGRNG